ncbi:hypothetical protein [Maribacter antarcticus]|uniref:hypothetical protein n=1 Tax=Maribacter antarcticus TaxID=505250 RepID=UPI00047CEC5D|nr:hypothetical protein [Maribacter antarcticus]
MKTILTTLLVFATLALNAQLVVDDFSTAAMRQVNVKTPGEKEFKQTGNRVLNKKRTVVIKIKDNPENQLFLAQIAKGKLVSSIGCGITGVVELRYGYDSTEKMNLDLSKYKNLNIQYDVKSNFGRVYVSLFSNGPNRGLWRGRNRTTELFQGSVAPNGSSRPFVLKIPLNEFIKIQDNSEVDNKFTIKDVDYMKVQFLSQGKQGLNFIVNKIWFD